jgi:hypothetical protein
MWFLATPAFAIPDESTQWTDVLQSANPRIECATVGTEPWCRSIGLVALPIEKVAATLENMAAHQELFESIVSIRVLTPDTMHITLDYPFPLWDRDYVAKYTRSNDGGVWRYRWEGCRATAADGRGVEVGAQRRADPGDLPVASGGDRRAGGCRSEDRR